MSIWIRLDKKLKIIYTGLLVFTISAGIATSGYAGIKKYIDMAVDSKIMVSSMETNMRISSMESDLKHIKDSQSETNLLLRDIIKGLAKR